ncbi:DUF4254 domain-containing protein [Nocardia blacklockiae]|uniref:DUF4254 domain-containing protein n=1 Tax=Nocardia blacklockiae TaxID=480036 RepID=UPI0018947027|nr:DUF4254 domain-containing protein [Nocardia blacklockiae]MBF6172009.1 DUF4254 domain-containing protein [Nocardia blacklockiae]
MSTEYADGRIGFGELPSAAELLRAFRADTDGRGHPVLDAAAELVQCHERRRRARQAAHAPGLPSSRVAAFSHDVDDVDVVRRELIERIDNWVADNIAHRAGASLHTETLGSVIDRMAAKWVAAQHALGLPAPAAGNHRRGVDSEAHLQWVRLAELADGYKDLVTDVTEHRRRLPVF